MILKTKKEDFPIIYLRYLNGNLQYVGESSSLFNGRDCREDHKAGDYDTIKILKAPKNLKRRHYWEAWLILKLKPIMQAKLHVYLKRFNEGNNIANKTFKRKNLKNETKEKLKKIYLLNAYDHLKQFSYCIKKAGE
jgi:hypothetical protein